MSLGLSLSLSRVSRSRCVAQSRTTTAVTRSVTMTMTMKRRSIEPTRCSRDQSEMETRGGREGEYETQSASEDKQLGTLQSSVTGERCLGRCWKRGREGREEQAYAHARSLSRIQDTRTQTIVRVCVHARGGLTKSRSCCCLRGSCCWKRRSRMRNAGVSAPTLGGSFVHAAVQRGRDRFSCCTFSYKQQVQQKPIEPNRRINIPTHCRGLYTNIDVAHTT